MSDESTGQSSEFNTEECRALLAEAESARTAYSSLRAEFDALIADIRQKQRDIGDVATQSVAASSKLADAQAVIAEKSAHIEDARKHSDDVRASLEKVLTESRALQAKVTGHEGETQKAAEDSKEVVAELRAAKVAMDSELATLKKQSEVSATDAERTKNLADRAKVIDERIGQYESQLHAIAERSNQTLGQIEELLPGATSTGLASAFDKRRQTFLKPALMWQKVFVGSLIALVVLASTGLIQVWWSDVPLTLDEELKFLMLRLPVAGALIWLALHASHEATLAKRLGNLCAGVCS